MKHVACNIQEKDSTKITDEAINVLKKGGLVIAPSDTVYGLLVDATNEQAVKKLIQFKNRPPGKPISVFVSDFSMMKKVAQVTPKQELILKELLPGPFTVILKSMHKVSRLLESEKGTLGIRIPRYQLINRLIREFGRPVTATSANMSGHPPHYSIDSLVRELPQSKKSLIDLIIDVGKLPHNKPSTVIDLTTPSIKIVRKGDIVRTAAQSFISSSDRETKKIGQYLLQKYSAEISKKSLIFIIEGELGVGKTVMVKGIAEKLGINNIISPTFVVYYEYKVTGQNIKLLYHFDLYQVQEADEFKYLHVKNLLKPRALLCFEWGEKAGEIIDMLKSKAKIVYIEMKYVNEKERRIKISKYTNKQIHK